jgi:hypothetical protein
MQVRPLVTPVDLRALCALAKGKHSIVHQEAAVRAAASKFILRAKQLAAGEVKGRTCCLVCSNPGCRAIRRAEDGQAKYKVCGRCSRESYCSKSCQVQHWRVHKKTCMPAAP